MYYQQGDILLKKIDILPEGEQKKVEKFILAEGEVTGHCHTMIGDLSIVKKEDKLFVKSDDKSKVTHQEHGLIVVDPGIYEIEKVNEYDHFEEEARKVQD